MIHTFLSKNEQFARKTKERIPNPDRGCNNHRRERAEYIEQGGGATSIEQGCSIHRRGGTVSTYRTGRAGSIEKVVQHL